MVYYIYVVLQGMPMKSLTNVEIALLEVIAEKGESSGYQIAKLVAERGYKAWAEIGTTSIYVGLEKLSKKKLVSCHVPGSKQGKGPLPRYFRLTRQGLAVLRKEILRILTSSRERQRVFDLGIAGIPLLPRDEVISALSKRKEFLAQAAEKIRSRFHSEGGQRLPLHTRAVFRHPLFLIGHELRFTEELINDLKSEGPTGGKHD